MVTISMSRRHYTHLRTSITDPNYQCSDWMADLLCFESLGFVKYRKFLSGLSQADEVWPVIEALLLLYMELGGRSSFFLAGLVVGSRWPLEGFMVSWIILLSLSVHLVV